MSLFRPIPTKTFAVARVDRLLGRIYSLALAAIAVEAIVNGFGGLAHLHLPIFLASVSLYAITVLGVIYSQWFSSGNPFWLRASSILVLLLLITWPLACDYQSLPEGYQPWIWWTLGIAMVAGGTAFPFGIGISYLIAVPSIWLVLSMSDYVGNQPAAVAIQGSFHLFLFPATLVAVALALRWEAAKVDIANQKAIDSAVESARLDAVELERSRLDALVHDSVLTSLLLAAKAESPEQLKSAKESAANAVSSVRRAALGIESHQTLTVTSFFDALKLAILDADSDCLVSIERANDQQVPPDVAKALTEATLQAIDNALKHSLATKREVMLRGQKLGIKIIIHDNGRGFRPNRISRDRMGLRKSIIGRVESVGGEVFLNTRPGLGTTLILEWQANDD